MLKNTKRDTSSRCGKDSKEKGAKRPMHSIGYDAKYVGEDVEVLASMHYVRVPQGARAWF